MSKLHPSALDAHLGFWLRFVSNHVSSRFQALLAEQACSVTEWVALRCLYERPQTTHAELIQALGMTKGATSKLISRLEAKGLALRGLAEGGQREQVVTLTRQGRAQVPRLAALADANDAHFFAHLDARTHTALRDVLRDLVAYHHLPAPPLD
ncbi:MAG: winged helix DNA-binding protein [Rhodocyclaceae bacterium]|jgi:DNA-binding MarR family transcriptional regulator